MPVVNADVRKGTGREKWHGTTNGYTNYKCRCKKCRAAWTNYIIDYRARRYAKKQRLYCAIEDCPNLESIAAGNGLCDSHARKLLAERRKKKLELERRRASREKAKKKKRVKKTKAAATS